MDDARNLMTPRRDRWYRLSLIIISVGAASLIAAAILIVLALTGSFNSDYSGPGTTTAFGGNLLTDLLTPKPTPTAPLPTPDLAPIARLVIPKYDINAPVVVRGVDANNVMETPDGPSDVAWYKFTSPPGAGSNAVFAGHVDYINYGAAVFYNLKDLAQGDTVEVRLASGTVYKYAVESRQVVGAEPPQQVLASIVGPTQQDVVTLITCGGTFDSKTHQYDQRVIVRAARVLDNTVSSAAAPSR